MKGYRELLVESWVYQAVRQGRFADEAEVRRTAYVEIAATSDELDGVVALWSAGRRRNGGPAKPKKAA